MTTTTMTLTAFLTARLDEDARLASDDYHSFEWGQWHGLTCLLCQDLYDVPCTCGVPARVLREVEAKRAIVALHGATFGGGLVEFCGTCGWDETHIAEQGGCFDREHEHYPCPTLRHLAAVYADHPDYREEWRP